MKKIATILFLLSCCYSQAGSSFRMGTNAREIALSNSLVSNYNHGFNAFSNPALLNKVTKAEYGFSLFSLSLDRSIQSFSFSTPLPPIATLGISIFRSSINDIPGYDGLGNPTGTQYKTYESYAMATFAIKINKLLAGVNFKLFQSKLVDGVEADGIGFDFGLHFEINKKNNIGLKISNIASKYNWSFDYNNFNQQYEEEHPLYISIGYSSILNYNSDDFLILGQFDLYDEYKQNLNLGLEYKLNNIKHPFYIRSGTKIIKNYDLIEYDLAFGFGLPIKLKNSNMIFDYAINLGMPALPTSLVMDKEISHVISFSFLK